MTFYKEYLEMDQILRASDLTDTESHSWVKAGVEDRDLTSYGHHRLSLNPA